MKKRTILTAIVMAVVLCATIFSASALPPNWPPVPTPLDGGSTTFVLEPSDADAGEFTIPFNVIPNLQQYIQPGDEIDSQINFVNESGVEFEIKDYWVECTTKNFKRTYNKIAVAKIGPYSTANLKILKNMSDADWYAMVKSYFNCDDQGLYTFANAYVIGGGGGNEAKVETSPEIIALMNWYNDNFGMAVTFDRTNVALNSDSMRLSTYPKGGHNHDNMFPAKIGENGHTLNIRMEVDGPNLGNGWMSSTYKMTGYITLQKVEDDEPPPPQQYSYTVVYMNASNWNFITTVTGTAAEGTVFTPADLMALHTPPAGFAFTGMAVAMTPSQFTVTSGANNYPIWLSPA